MSGFDDDALGGLPARAAEAEAALLALQAPAEKAAGAIDAAFARAGAGLARALARAAADGEISLAELARAVMEVVGQALGRGDLAQGLAQTLSSGFAGARAEGGPVLPGGAYLVGERGPEVFRPGIAGEIVPSGGGGGGGGVSVVVNVQGGEVAGLARSDAQLAQALARAVSLGARGL